MAQEELFNESIELSDGYLGEDDMLEIPENGDNPDEGENKKTPGEGENQKLDKSGEKENKDSKDDKVPKEVQDLIDTKELQNTGDEDKEGDNEDNKDNKDSGNDSPDSPDKDDSDDSSPSTNADESLEAYIVIGNQLKEGGSFSTFNEEEFKKLAKEKGDPDQALVEMQRNELEKAKEEYINSLSDEDKELYEAKEAGVNLNEIGQIDNAINSYSKLTDEQLENEENEETSKALIREYMKLKSFDKDEIEDTIELYDEKGKLSEKSKNARDKIVDSLKGQKSNIINQQKEQKQKEQQNLEERKKKLKQTIHSFEEIIPGVKMNDEIKDEVYKDMTTPVAEDENGQPVDALGYQMRKNPEAFNAVLYYLNKVGVFNFDDDGNYKPDFSKIKKAEQTKEAKRLSDVFNKNESFRPNGSKGTGNSKVDKLFEDME